MNRAPLASEKSTRSLASRSGHRGFDSGSAISPDTELGIVPIMLPDRLRSLFALEVELAFQVELARFLKLV
jgi:hypothetical protein